MINKLKKLFSKKEVKTYSGDKLKERDYTYILLLRKFGKVNDDFNALVKLILKKLETAGVIQSSFTKSVLQRYDDFVIEGSEYVLFGLPFNVNSLKDLTLEYDEVKKEIQALIEKTPKYKKDYALVNTANYKLTQDELTLPIDFDSILFELHQQIKHTRVNLYENKAIPKEKMVSIVSDTLGEGIDWYVTLEFDYTFLELNDETLSKIKSISQFLEKNEMIVSKLDLNDIERRYNDAVKDYGEQLTKNGLYRKLKQAGNTDTVVKRIIKDVSEKTPRIYIFQVLCQAINLNDFKKVQRELKQKLFQERFELSYGVKLTTNVYGGSSYGCFIKFRPDLLEIE